jgi:hypothetical protein
MKTGRIVKHHIRAMIEYCEMHEPNEFARRHDPRLLKRVYSINYRYCKEVAKISHAEQPRFLRDPYCDHGILVLVTHDWYSTSTPHCRQHLSKRGIAFSDP